MRKFLTETILFSMMLTTIGLGYLLIQDRWHSRLSRFGNYQTESNLLVIPEYKDFDICILGSSAARVLSRSGNHNRVQEILKKKIINLGQGLGQGGPEKNYVYLTYFLHQKNNVNHIIYVVPPQSFFTDNLDNLKMDVEPFSLAFFEHARAEGIDRGTLFQYVQSKFRLGSMVRFGLGLMGRESVQPNRNALKFIDEKAIQKNMANFVRNEKARPANFEEKFRYVEKICELAKERNIRLTFIFPAHLLHEMPHIEEVKEALTDLSSKYTMEIYDFSHSIKKEKYFYDHLHLNSNGVSHFTEKFLTIVCESNSK